MTASKVPAAVAALLFLLTLLPAPAAAQDEECTFPGLGLFFMDLQLPFSINLVPAGVTVLTPPTPSTHQSCDGWHEAVIQITIPDGCSQANVWIEFSDFAGGWLINLGDSLTNDGHGGFISGGANAELQIVSDSLSVFGARGGFGNELDDDPQTLLIRQRLVLEDSALKLTVGNQRVTWGQPLTVLQDSDFGRQIGRLFVIPSESDGSAVYLGVNRVIADNEDRKGCGAKRVMVSFE